MDTKQKIIGFIERYMDMENIGDDENIFEKGIVNSLFAMQLINFIENDFDIVVDNTELDLENFKSVNSISEFVKSKL